MRVRQGTINEPFLIDDRNGLDMGAKQVLDYVFGDGNYYVVGQKPCLSWSFGPEPSKRLESYTVVDRDKKTHVLYFRKVSPECYRPRPEKAVRDGEYFSDEKIFTPITQSKANVLNDFNDNFPNTTEIDPDCNKTIMDKVDTERLLGQIEQSDLEFKIDDELMSKRIEQEINNKLTDGKKSNKTKGKRGRAKKSVDNEKGL